MIRNYFNSKADSWDEVIAETNSRKLRALVDRLDVTPGSRVLDVGTGTGVFIPYLLNKVGNTGKLVALDIAEAMLGVFRSKECSSDVGLVQADIAFAPFISAYFDAVVCYSAFPHFQDKQGALMEVSRILKKDGALFICHTISRSEVNDIHRSIPAVCNDLLPDGDSMGILLNHTGFGYCSIYDLPDSYFLSARKLDGK